MFIVLSCPYPIVGGEVAQPHTAMPQTINIVVLSSIYITMTSSYEYKDGVAVSFPF